MLAHAAKKQVGLAVLLVFAVSLLTLLFNFLGTIACGALVGMMIGANKSRPAPWQVLFVSLIFPAVMVAFVCGWKPDLTTQGATVLCTICFAAFWASYLLSWLMIHLESQSEVRPVQAPQDTRLCPTPDLALCPTTAIEAPAAAADLSNGLRELQGVWQTQVKGLQGMVFAKTFHVKGAQFTLEASGPNGDPPRVLRGQLAVERLGAYRLLTLTPERPNAGTLPECESVDGTCSVLFRVMDATLALATNFKESGAPEPASLEIYTRFPP